MKTKDTTQRYGYSMYSKLCFGLTGTITIKFILIFITFCVSCVFLRIFGGVLSQIITSVIKADESIYFKENFYVILIFLVLSPLMFLKDISALKKFAFLGVVCIAVFMICILIKYFYLAFKTKSTLITYDMLYPIDASDIPSLFQKLTNLITGYFFHMNAFPIYLPLHPRSSKNYIKSTFIASIIVSVIYYLIGLAGFALYHNGIQSSILPNIKEDLEELFNKKEKTTMDFFLILVNFTTMCTFFINALFTMPLVFFALKKNLINLIFMIKRKVFDKKDIKDKEINSTVETKVVIESVSEKTTFFITLLTYVLVLFCTLNVEQIIVLNSIVGSTSGNILIIVAPALFVLILSKKGFLSFEKISALFFIIFGISILVSFFKFQIIDVFFKKSEI